MECSSCFAPHVQKHVDVILNKRRIGIGHESLVIKNPQTSCRTYVRTANCDRFTLLIPYAGTNVEFAVVFQATDPECPPDFMFADMKFFVPVTEIETLREWDVRKSDGLYRVIKEIMMYYKKKNIEDLEKYSELNYEYLSLFQIKNFNEEDVEVYVPFKSKLPITFLIRLRVEFCDILPDVTQNNGVESALLLLIFSDRDSDKCGQRLYLSEEIKNALGLNGNFEFPVSVREFQLNRYVVAVEDKLRCQVDLIASRYEKVEEFNFLLEINLPENYPVGMPDLIFRSIYHTNMGVPTSIVVDRYPYCSTWSLDKVFWETVKFIQAYALLLRDDSDPGFYLPIESIPCVKEAPPPAEAVKEPRSNLLNFRMEETHLFFEGGSECHSDDTAIYSEDTESFS